MRQAVTLLCATLVLQALAVPAFAQAAEKFRTRLSPVPVDIPMSANIAGSGAVTAVLEGAKLTVNGTFAGMKGAATMAHVHRSTYGGVPGPSIGDLTVSKGDSGTVSGTLTLNAGQIEDLRKGRLYVQIHSEKAPDGNLRGWLLHQER